MNSIVIDFKSFGTTLSTRDLGKTIREKIESSFSAGAKIQIDLSQVELMTSGFSDEVFGILLEKIGMKGFRNNLIFSFPKDDEKKKLIQALVGRAISDRMKRAAN
jgi:hypothetical protein